MPQPEPAVSSFLTQEPAAPEAPTRRLRMGDVASAPVVSPGTGGNLLATCDPFLAAALPYFKHAINWAFEDAYVAAMAGQALATDDRACVETLPINPEPYWRDRALRLPLLAGYLVSGKSSDRTLHHARVTSLYRLIYALPPGLSFNQHTRLGPMLSAVVDVLTLAIEEGGLDSYSSGARVWEDAGIDHVKLTAFEVGRVQYDDSAGYFLAVQADLEVERSERWDSASGLPLWSHDLTLAAGDPGGGDALDDLVQIESENES